MLDWLESMEDAAGLRLDDMTRGLPVGEFRCDCGRIDKLDCAMPAYYHPYAPPMCRECFKEQVRESTNKVD